MVHEPDPFLESFKEAGADRLTVHVEACRHLHRTLSNIRELGLRAGVALNPATPASMVAPVLHLVDLVLVMTVNPGFGGQRFLPETLGKLAEVRRMVERMGAGPVELEVDGGIDYRLLLSSSRREPRLWWPGRRFFVNPTAPGRSPVCARRLGHDQRHPDVISIKIEQTV